MADPVTASIMLACSAVKIGASIANLVDNRRARKAVRTSYHQRIEFNPEDERAQEEARRLEQEQKCKNATEEVLFVLAVLGQRLLHLEVVSFQSVPEVQKVVEGLWPDEYWREAYGRLDQPLQYAVVIAMFFCAECWPMHIYRGFGTAVLNNFRWTNPDPDAEVEPEGTDARWVGVATYELDKILASLKSLPRPPLLTKVPSGISTEEPDFGDIELSKVEKMKGLKRSEKKDLIEMREILRETFKAINKAGFPQPKDGSYTIKATKTLWATWDSPFACKAVPDKDVEDIILRQSDPGRLLYAFTIGGHLELKPGEHAAVIGDHADALVRWLHGLPGTSFDIIPSTELDFSKVKFKKSTVKFFKKSSLDFEYMLGITNPNSVNIIPGKRVESKLPQSPPQSPLAPPAYSPLFAPTPLPFEDLTKRMTGATVTEINPDANSPPVSPVSQAPFPRRRPVPKPQMIPIRRARVMYDFEPQDAGELRVQSGMVVDILKDLGDGWVTAKLPDGTSGIIPDEFTIPV